MVIRRTSQRLILALFLLALPGAAGRLAAQQPPSSGSLTIERIADERERNKALPADLSWSPSGKTLSFIRTAARPGKAAHGSPVTEIWSIDAATGSQSLLVSDAKITAAFGGHRSHGAPGEEEAAEARQLQDYAWAPGGHALLLASGASLAWFDLDAQSFRPLVTDRTDLASPQISPDGSYVSFVQGHTLWLADAATGVARALSPEGNSDLREGEPDWVYLRELGLHRAYWWSPDSINTPCAVPMAMSAP
jgi:dipeptidyl aminopeptidase/acylaminoacyl peptidase